MNIETAIKRRDRAVMALRDLHGTASVFGMSSDDMNTRVAEIHATICAKCPEWVHSYVRGYRQALTDALYRYELVFGGMIEGRFYSTHRDRADYYEKHGIEPNAYADDGKVTARGHYWRRSLDDGAPKAFFIS
jgi:hypothetical protein